LEKELVSNESTEGKILLKKRTNEAPSRLALHVVVHEEKRKLIGGFGAPAALEGLLVGEEARGK